MSRFFLGPRMLVAGVSDDRFSVEHLDVDGLKGHCGPLVGMDHFRMRARTFAPHPHAGFAAVTYLFEDSAGAMRNRDSLGQDFVVGPGELVWTQAGCGVLHDEWPQLAGVEVHGLQLFVNSAARFKHQPPRVQRLSRHDVPVIDDAAGNHVRIVSGQYQHRTSPLMLDEPFTLLDLTLVASVVHPLSCGWQAVVIVLEGGILLHADGVTQRVAAGAAIGLRADHDMVLLLQSASDQPVRAVLAAGAAINEPVVSYGPFVMNSQQELIDAMGRFRSGQMGRLDALA